MSSVSDVPPPPDTDPSSATPPPPPPDLAPPPGYTAYDNTPHQGSLRRVSGLAKAVVILTAIAGITTFVVAALSASVTSDAKNFLAGSISENEFDNAIRPLTAVQMISSIAVLAAGVLTIIWAYRIATNVRAFGRVTTWSPLFAIFGWFLPPMVLYVIPFLVLRELWKASAPTAVDGTDRWKREPDSPVLWAWFALFGIIPAILLAVQIGSFAAAGLPSGDKESLAETLDDFSILGWVAAIVTLAAAAAWVVFVRQLTQRHSSLTNET